MINTILTFSKRSYQYDYKFYHYSDFVTVEFPKNVGNSDEENVHSTKEQNIERCPAADTIDEGLTFSSQILFMSS